MAPSSPLLRVKQPYTSSAMLHITDWLPTFLSLAGADLTNIQVLVMYNIPYRCEACTTYR